VKQHELHFVGYEAEPLQQLNPPSSLLLFIIIIVIFVIIIFVCMCSTILTKTTEQVFENLSRQQRKNKELKFFLFFNNTLVMNEGIDFKSRSN